MSQFEYRDFAQFLMHLEDGDLNADASRKMQQISQALAEHVDTHGGNPEATLTVKLKFKSKSGVVNVSATLNDTLPQPPRQGSVLWTSQNGFTPQNPRQSDMFDGPRAISTESPQRQPGPLSPEHQHPRTV
ncbi:hypothetical protein [Polycladidibacter hongkongensis]|uniref:hypothetical protein n=1 Tax=Polycladidibacter hongkongensis TaxID=1647556 RepID=UPI000836ADAE|nr:hypothetical protein [Pseudovibrio hongkongensis]